MDDARARLERTVAELPVTQAMADYIVAQYRRNWAHADLSAARSRLGMPTDGGRQSSTDATPLQEYVGRVAERMAQQQIQTDRGDQ